MSSEDPFTSIQWDRGEDNQYHTSQTPTHDTIAEGDHDIDDHDGSDTQVNVPANKDSDPIHKVDDASSDSDTNVKNANKIDNDDEDVDLPHKINDDHDDDDASSADDSDPSNSLLVNNDEDKTIKTDSGSSLNDSDKDNDQADTTASINSINSKNSISQGAGPVGFGNKTSIHEALASPAGKTIGSSDPIGSTDEPNLFYDYTIDSSVVSPFRDLDSSSKPYISYQVSTTTNHPSVLKLLSSKPSEQGLSITCKIRRRYGDFRFLHDCLSNDYPQLLVPPLPSKLNFKYLTGDTFSTSFVHKRLHSLDRFVKFITHHSILSQLSIFHLFLSDSPDWLTFTKNLKISKLGSHNGVGSPDDEMSSGFTSNVMNKVVNEDLLTETVMNFLTPSKHKRETNKDILEISDKLKKLYENLLKLDKIFSKLNKKNHDLSQDYDQFANQINKLSKIQNSSNTSSDGGAADDLGVDPDATAVPNDQHFVNNFKVFAQSLSYFSNNWSDLHKYIDESFLISLKDCSKYIISLTNLIELLHNKKIDLQVLQDYLGKTRTELANLGGHQHNSSSINSPPNPVINSQHPTGIVNNTTQLIKDTLSTSATPHIGSSHTENKITKLQMKIEQLENEIKNQTQLVLDLSNRIINEEYPNWDKFNKNELKQSMVGLCEQEIKFYSGLVDNWSEVELKLMKRLDELK